MLVSNAVAVWMPIVIRRVIDSGIRVGAADEISTGCMMLLGLALVHGLCTYLTGIWTETASQNVAFDLRNRFHEKLQALSFSFHDEAETGQLLTRSVSDVDRLRFLTGRAFLHLVQMVTLVSGISVAMLMLNVRLGLLTISLVPVVVVGAFFLGSRLRPLSMRVRDSEADLTSCLEQNLRGSRIVKAYGREDREMGRFGARNAGLLDLQWREAKLRAFYLPMMEMLTGVGTLIVLVVGGRMVIRGGLSVGELVAFMAYVAQLVNPGRRFGWIVASIAQASASAERIFEILDMRSEITDAPDAAPLHEVRGAVCFDHVTFAYSRTAPVLDDVSFEIPAGERVALLGGTGSGKSSIISLIPRFYDPTSGSVSVDGIDIRTLTVKSLRDHIGVVFQDTILFASTVRENIAFGRPEASQEEIEEAARIAHAHEFITALPRGYDSRVGEQGMSLSGGQKQRLAIARAILKNPEILVLDDATSSVDTETEMKIQTALDALMRNRTAIIIAQRLSTIREADRVLVLDRGRIVATGVRSDNETPHDQLMRSCGLYVDIVNTQLRSSAEESRAPSGRGPAPGSREGGAA
jgi:ATP-binding cassette subfamily B protein